MSDRRGDAGVLPHGWTAAGVEAAARRAAWYSRWSVPAFTERVDIARFAALEHLYICQDHGPGCDLVVVGVRAVERCVAGDETFYGVVLRRRGAHGAPMPRFHRYWTAVPPRSMEEGVVEVMALRQIWPRLPEADRHAILALATHADYGRAAAALKMTRRSFMNRICRARRSFLALWHEHEAPSGMWSRDVPLTNPRGHRTNSIGSTLRRRRKQAAGAGRNGNKPAQPLPDPVAYTGHGTATQPQVTVGQWSTGDRPATAVARCGGQETNLASPVTAVGVAGVVEVGPSIKT
jgi:hypothetical protein